jgi:hypothetical protein
MSDPLSLTAHRLRCGCSPHLPLELRYHRGDLVLGRFCSGCDSVVDVRAKLQDWLALNQLVAILLDQAERGS